MRPNAALRLLTDVAAIADVQDPRETVDRLGGVLVPALADVCAIDVVRDGALERLAVVASGRRGGEREAALRDRVPRSSAQATAPVLLQHPRDELLTALGATDGDDALLDLLEPRSALSVPLRTRGRAIGNLLLLTTGSAERVYDATALEFAEVLSGLVALALDNAGLASEVEQLAEQQRAALSHLAEAVTIQTADGRLVYANEAAARALGFATAADLLATPPQEIVDAYESFKEDGTPLRLEDLPGRKVLAGLSPEPLIIRAIHKGTREERWRIVKATGVAGADGRPRLAVNVLEDVTDVKRAEASQRFLAEASAVLSSSLDYGETLKRVADLVVPGLADWCAVSMPDEGYLRSVAVAHVDPERVRFASEYNRRFPTAITASTGTAQVLREGVAQVVNEIPDELLDAAIPDPDQRAALREIGMHAAVIVPMIGAGAPIGTITLVSAESRRTFGAAQVELAEELGRRAGIAVENARLYTERSRIAETLQASLLPDDLPAVPHRRLASLYRPAGPHAVVGGDFYDAFDTSAGWMLVVGDVTGRGTDAAALTGQVRHTLRTAATLLGDPAAAVGQLNAALAGDRALSLCTVCAAVLCQKPEGTEATIVCAGHPQPVLVRDGTATLVGRTGPVVGAWADSAWAPATIQLKPGDLLVLYTDGVLDARGEGGRFGERRLLETLEDATDAEDAIERIRAALDAFEHGAQVDDTAVLVVQEEATVGSWSAPADPASIAGLRNAVAAFALDAGARRETVDDVKLAVSEALTNAVVHAYAGIEPGDVEVRAWIAGGRLELCVEDSGVGVTPRPDSPGLGLGLPLIASLAVASEITPRESGGTVVGMTFELP